MSTSGQKLKLFRPSSLKQQNLSQPLVVSSQFPVESSDLAYQQQILVRWPEDLLVSEQTGTPHQLEQAQTRLIVSYSGSSNQVTQVVRQKFPRRILKEAYKKAATQPANMYNVLITPDIGSQKLIHCNSLQDAANVIRLHVGEAIQRFGLQDCSFLCFSGDSVAIKIGTQTGTVKLQHAGRVVSGKVPGSTMQQLVDGRLATEAAVSRPANVSVDKTFELF